MLHAFRLAFSHPITGQRVAVESPLPDDFQKALAALRRGAGAPPRKRSGLRT
jgi:23S rRNA pseudouridine1911/1915/1917 synthase